MLSIDIHNAAIETQLQAAAAQYNLPVPAVVEMAVREYLAHHAPASAKGSAAMDDFFGMWKHRSDIGDGVDYQRALRAEWDERDRAIDDRSGL